jgi:hypothetical protein
VREDMPSEAVLIKELKIEQTKNKQNYTIVIDGYNNRWNIFNPPISMQLEINKAYVFKYEINGEFKNVKSVETLANIFQQKALKEVANKNDIIKNYSIAISYATNLASAGTIPLDDLFVWADKIYETTTAKADKIISDICEDN